MIVNNYLCYVQITHSIPRSGEPNALTGICTAVLHFFKLLFGIAHFLFNLYYGVILPRSAKDYAALNTISTLNGALKQNKGTKKNDLHIINCSKIHC